MLTESASTRCSSTHFLQREIWKDGVDHYRSTIGYSVPRVLPQMLPSSGFIQRTLLGPLTWPFGGAFNLDLGLPVAVFVLCNSSR